MLLINYELCIIYRQLNKWILCIKKEKEKDLYKVYSLTKSWNTSVKVTILVYDLPTFTHTVSKPMETHFCFYSCNKILENYKQMSFLTWKFIS